MVIRRARSDDRGEVARLVAEFRVELARLRGKVREPDLEAAGEELAEYESSEYPVFVAESSGSGIAGYLVCRVERDVLWVESIYVLPEFRRTGVGSALFCEAERLAQELGGETTYNFVHPDNDSIIAFLRGRGYSVLNLIELRRTRSGEEVTGKIRVGEHEFDY